MERERSLGFFSSARLEWDLGGMERVELASLGRKGVLGRDERRPPGPDPLGTDATGITKAHAVVTIVSEPSTPFGRFGGTTLIAAFSIVAEGYMGGLLHQINGWLKQPGHGQRDPVQAEGGDGWQQWGIREMKRWEGRR